MVQFCRERRGALTISLHVQPKARKTEIIGVHGDAIKVKVASPPVDGAANEELVRFFAELLGLPKSRVLVKQGGRSRRKLLEIEGATAAGLTDLLIRRGLLTIRME